MSYGTISTNLNCVRICDKGVHKRTKKACRLGHAFHFL